MLAVLEAVCRAPLLEEECEEAYHFLHDVTREVVETGLGAARRLVLHRRMAEALERQPGDPPLELLAYHLQSERGARQGGAVSGTGGRSGLGTVCQRGRGGVLPQTRRAPRPPGASPRGGPRP